MNTTRARMENTAKSEIEHHFLMIRPYCLLLVEKPSKESVRLFNDMIKHLDVGIIQQLQEFLLLEIIEVVSVQNERTSSQKLPPEFITDYVLCMENIISMTDISSWALLNRILSKIIMLIGQIGPEERVLSEELKIAVVRCTKEAMKRSTEKVLQEMYSEQNVPKLGCILYNLQQLFEHENGRELQILSMECLKCFIDLFFESSLKSRIQDPIATFVPGLSVALVNVATSKALNNSVIVETALNTWTNLLAGVFDDELLKLSSFKSSCAEHLKVPNKDNAWVQMASERLQVLMPRVAALDRNSSWKIRLAVADWASTLLRKCRRSLSRSVAVWLDVLVSLSIDDYSSVKTLSEDALNDFSHNLQSSDECLLDIINESLFSVVLQLPKIVKHSNDEKLLSLVNQLYGYIHILGSRINEFLNSSVHMEKLSLAFLHLTEFDVRNMHLVSETRSWDLADKVSTMPASPSLSWQFQNFNDELIYQRIIQIWRLLGKNGDLHILVDLMLDRFHQSSIYRMQSVLILNEILFGYMESESVGNDSVSTINWVVDEYLESSIWDLKIARDSNSLDINNDKYCSTKDFVTLSSNNNSGDSIMMLNGNIILICLCVEGIAVCAQVMKSDFKLLLRKVLYEILEKCGSNNVMISDAAMKCLNQIAQSCDYRCASDLIMDNADYLLNSITLKLIHQVLDPKIPTVLHVSLQHGSREMINIAEDVINNMLKCIEDLSGSKLVPYISVLNSFCLTVLRWFPKKEVGVESRDQVEEQTHDETVLQFILNFHQEKLLSENLSDEDGSIPEKVDDSPVSDDNEDDPLESCPSYIKLVSKILERCGHLLPTSEPIVSYWIFNVVNNAFLVLQGYDNILLPSVHKIWPALSNRFVVENFAVLKSAFRTMCSLVDVCGDFVRSRILKEVWPRLIEFLKSHSKRKVSIEQFSPTFKLLLEVLENLGGVVKKLDLDELELDNLASCSLVYLNLLHPQIIRSAATKLLEDLIQLNSDLMWLKINDAINYKNPDSNGNLQEDALHYLMAKLDN